MGRQDTVWPGPGGQLGGCISQCRRSQYPRQGLVSHAFPPNNNRPWLVERPLT